MFLLGMFIENNSKNILKLLNILVVRISVYAFVVIYFK